MAAELVVLQHHPRTGPSAFVEVLDARAQLAPWRLLEVAEGAELPDPGALAGVLVMGGPMGLPDAEQHPWMAEEVSWLGRVVAAEVPVLGVCLGAQLLAAALGGKVERREAPEIGYVALDRTDAASGDEVAAGWPDGTAALFVHEDQVTVLPEDAEVVLEGSDGPSAWRSGSALAIQFHPETTLEQLQAWTELPELRDQLAAAGVDVQDLLAEAERRSRFTVPQGRALLGRWIDGPVRKHLAD